MKLLLLVQNETDVAHLDGAAQAILASAITGVWVVFSPAITVNASEAAAKLDAEIAGLRKAERDAADRSDYAAAAGYKTQREGKELDKGKVLRDAWKTAPEEARKTKTQSIFSPFTAQLQPKGLNVRVTGHSDHYEREQWVAMLNSLSGVWFKPFTPGSFIVAWPESVETSLKATTIYAKDEPSLGSGMSVKQMTEMIEPGTFPKGAGDAIATPAPKLRKAELEEMHHSSVKKLARELGLDVTGFSMPDIIEAIMNAEAAPKKEPALAEY